MTFEALIGWRAGVADEAKVPAYAVFTDATLTAIAETRPASPVELARISGVVARKIEKYGDDVLAILAGRDPVAFDGNLSPATDLADSGPVSTP